MAYNLHFRPRPIDVNSQLQVLHEEDLDEDQLNEIESESSHFKEIKGQKKRKKEDELEEEPLPEVKPGDKLEVPIPHIRNVDENITAEEFKRPQNYVLIEDKTTEELDASIEYDLESDDDELLNLLAKSKHTKKPRSPIPEDDLETIIDVLEKESFKSKFSEPEDIELFQSYRQSVDDIPCSICNHKEEEEDNCIVFCDGCNIAVHQVCYGVEEIPSGSWVCRVCEAGEKEVSCIFCPNTKGAFKRTLDGRWAHVVCALWTPGVIFDNNKTMEGINRISHIPKKLWSMECSLCSRRMGVCMECSFPGCKTSFHVTCAQSQGLYNEIQRSTKDKGVKFVAYCRRHTLQHELDKENPFNGKELTQEQKERLKAAFVKYNKKLNVQMSTLILVYNYWCMKRKFHQEPLLRRFQNLAKETSSQKSHSRLSADEAYSRLRRLRQDFEKVRLLIDLVRKREQLKRDYAKIFSDWIEARITDGRVKYQKRLERVKAKLGDSAIDEIEVYKTKKPRKRKTQEFKQEYIPLMHPELSKEPIDQFFDEELYDSESVLPKKQKRDESEVRQGKEEREEEPEISVRNQLLSLKRVKHLSLDIHSRNGFSLPVNERKSESERDISENEDEDVNIDDFDEVIEDHISDEEEEDLNDEPFSEGGESDIPEQMDEPDIEPQPSPIPFRKKSIFLDRSQRSAKKEAKSKLGFENGQSVQKQRKRLKY